MKSSLGLPVIVLDWLHLKPPPSPLVLQSSRMEWTVPLALVSGARDSASAKWMKLDVEKDTWNHRVM